MMTTYLSDSSVPSLEKAQNHANWMFGPRRKIFSLPPSSAPAGELVIHIHRLGGYEY